MSILLAVVLPVFLVIGAGFLSAKRRLIPEAGIDGLMRFAQGIAMPCLLFRAMAGLDLEEGFDPDVVATFYAAALACFLLGAAGARLLFRRPMQDAVAIGFAALFSNSLLLGLPITERAFGPAGTEANFAILAVHSPFCYAVGITAMEIVRAQGAPVLAILAKIVRAMLGNALILGILLGLAANVSGLTLPLAVEEALDLLIRAALPTALFGLGGVLARYRLEGDLPTILFVVSLSLLVHPALAWGLGRLLDLDRDAFRSVIVTAAMAPGANAYLFASMYGRAMRVAASCVLLGTALSILSASVWLALLA